MRNEDFHRREAAVVGGPVERGSALERPFLGFAKPFRITANVRLRQKS